MVKLIIQGRLPGLNEYIAACRTNRYAGANMKQETETAIQWEIQNQLRSKTFSSVSLTFHWYETNKKRDKDNIAFAKKFILDALQDTGTIPGDGWKAVDGFKDRFYVDRKNPRVEIEIEAV